MTLVQYGPGWNGPLLLMITLVINAAVMGQHSSPRPPEIDENYLPFVSSVLLENDLRTSPKTKMFSKATSDMFQGSQPQLDNWDLRFGLNAVSLPHFATLNKENSEISIESKISALRNHSLTISSCAPNEECLIGAINILKSTGDPESQSLPEAYRNTNCIHPCLSKVVDSLIAPSVDLRNIKISNAIFFEETDLNNFLEETNLNANTCFKLQQQTSLEVLSRSLRTSIVTSTKSQNNSRTNKETFTKPYSKSKWKQNNEANDKANDLLLILRLSGCVYNSSAIYCQPTKPNAPIEVFLQQFIKCYMQDFKSTVNKCYKDFVRINKQSDLNVWNYKLLTKQADPTMDLNQTIMLGDVLDAEDLIDMVNQNEEMFHEDAHQQMQNYINDEEVDDDMLEDIGFYSDSEDEPDDFHESYGAPRYIERSPLPPMTPSPSFSYMDESYLNLTQADFVQNPDELAENPLMLDVRINPYEFQQQELGSEKDSANTQDQRVPI